MRTYRYILLMLALAMSASMRGQYNPANPAEPGQYYTLTLQATPSGGGSFNLNTVTSYSKGTNVSLRAYSNTGFRFAGWELDGEVVSTSPSYSYTMPARNVRLVAHYKYEPDSPAEPSEPNLPVYASLNFQASPSEGGSFNISSGNRYEVGTSVSLRAYSNSNFIFKNWTENGEVISTSSSFQYVVKEGNPKLVANFTYSPGSPAEPDQQQPLRKLTLSSNPAGGGYFNISSGNSYEPGTTVYVAAYSNQWYTFRSWTLGDSVVSSNSSFTYVMPKHDASLTANYTYNYNPSTPDEPNKPSAEQANIYGMTENGVCGQNIVYPVYLENTYGVCGMVVDVQFPTGFIVNADNIALSERASGHEMKITDLGDNNYRFSLLGATDFTGDNGKMFEVPVTIPDTATMGRNYNVLLTHGVMHKTDSSQTAIPVRSGHIYVEKISEDGLYAKFSYDKLQGRVKFTNLSSSKATSYQWDFGDGITSTEKNPLHVFPKSGYYTVRLTANGEVDKDMAEQTVLINDESSWRVNGTFYLSDEETGVRYFTNAESLFQFIGATPLSGNVGIAVKGGSEFTLSLTADNVSLLKSIQSKLAAGQHTLSLSKNGTGRNPVLRFGKPGETIDKSFVDFFVELGKRMSNEGVDLKLWNVSFDPGQIVRLNNQAIHSGGKTKEVDFSPISPDLTFTWSLASTPDAVSGYETSGTRAIPAMTLVNEGEGNCKLTYNVVGAQNGVTFCEFTNTITITPALVGLFNGLSPANEAAVESTTVTLNWNRITNAVYDVYLWNAVNKRPATPTAEGISELRYTSSNFLQNGNTYKWQIVARNEGQTLSSDTMEFSVRNLPDLHVYAVDCSAPTAGDKFTVQWTVRNDGAGSTGTQSWDDYVWIVTDVYGGTQPSGNSANNATLLATVKNVKALEAGESYDNKVDVTLPERVYGNYYLLVASDMYNVADIQWSAVGGSVVNPYNPTQDGTGYKHLYATTSASYNQVYEQGETPTYSDNFFYKKIEISVPPLADLQVPSITAEVLPNLEPMTSAAAKSKKISESYGNIYDGDGNIIYSWQECDVPSAITAAGLRKTKAFYSGKKVVVYVTVTNKGGEDTKNSFNTVLYMSSSPDKDAAPLTAIGSKTYSKNIKAGESATLTYAFYLPYEHSGETYFHAYADINDAVYELANTNNNWGASDKYDVMLCPGADFVPGDLQVPASVATNTAFDVSYKVANHGPGIPYTSSWKDKIYISKKNTGIDESAVLLKTAAHGGTFMTTDRGSGGITFHEPEDYHYSGDNYTSTVSVAPSSLSTGTYYIYVKVDADDAVYEHDGEDNNVLVSAPIKLIRPDLTAELISISSDTLTTGSEVAITWKLKNTGSADIKDAKIRDAFYATVNQTATNGTQIATVENTVWIAAGQEKTLRANITVPKNSDLNGLRYIYVRTNTDNSLTEENTQNNTSGVLRSWCKYTTTETAVPKTVRGANLYLTDFTVPATVKPGSEVTVTYIARNNGDADLPGKEVAQEVFLTNGYNANPDNATPCEVVRHTGSVSKLKAGKAASMSLTFKVPDIHGGNKYLHLYVDRANSLGERNTSDNHTYASTRIAGNLPDLQVASFTVKDTLMTSENAEVAYTVSNSGEWDAGASAVAVYLSADNKLDSRDTKLSSTSLEALGKGNSKEQRQTVNIADRNAGNWYLLISVDDNDRVAELSKSNNVRAVPVTIVQSPLPDLTVTSLSTDTMLTSGQSMTVASSIRNSGKRATRNNKWSDTWYLSNSVVLNTSDAIKLGAKAHVGNIETDGEYTTSASFTIPANVQGNYMLFAVTDAADAIVEEDENNNVKGIPVFINGSADTPADLVVSSVTAPGNIKAGEEISITYEIENTGEYAAAANLHDVIYLSEDDKWDTDDPMVGVVTGNVSINPGQTETRKATGRITNVPEGDYYVIVKTNATRTVAESKTDNNVGVAKSASSLAFNTISLGGTATVNTSGYYKIEIPSGYENKTVGFYLEHPADASPGLYAAYNYVPSTAKYEFTSSQSDSGLEMLVPNVQAGKYYVFAQDNAAMVNATGNVFTLDGSSNRGANTQMTLSAKDVNFGASTLSIKEGGNGGWVSANINGALFDSIMDFRLMLDNTVIPAEAVSYNGITKSRVTFNLNDAKVGTYAVVSELPDGTVATLPNGFRVIPGASVNLAAKIDAPNVVRVGSYAPVSISYANGGNTDCELADLILVIDNGYLATTIEGLDNHQSVLHLPIDTESNVRGYKTIPPGTQKTINIFMYQTTSSSNITIYLVK